MAKSNEDLIKLYKELRNDLLNCPCLTSCESCIPIEATLYDIRKELGCRGLRRETIAIEEWSGLSKKDIQNVFDEVLNRALDLAIRELDIRFGVCPLDAYDVNMDCDNCNDDMEKCWREYFISLAQKQ